MISDAGGLPLLVTTTPANVRDEVPTRSMLRRLPDLPREIIGDRGYGFPWIIRAVERWARGRV